MKRLCNRFCNFMQLCATLLLLPAVALAQDVPVPEPTPPEPAAETNTVPPVLLRDIRVQTIGEERHLEELPEGLLFVEATTGKLCLADENDPHGRYVCLCRDIDWHTFTNDLKINGHKLLFNEYWSQVAEGGSLLYRFGTNSWLRFVGETGGTLANMTVDAFDPTNGTMVVTADATSSPVLQVCTNLLEADAWHDATNAVVSAETDASTTWIITLLGTQAEFYRVLATVEREAGIHAERPLHANQGIVMDGTTWTSFPDTNAFLTAETDAAALAALAAETSARTAADSALDGRVEALEYPETCTLWWTDDTMAIGYNYLQTNFPTRNMRVIVTSDTGDRSISLPSGFEPERTTTIEVLLNLTGSHQIVMRHGTTSIQTMNVSSSTTRRYIFYWDPVVGVWTVTSHTQNTTSKSLAGGSVYDVPPGAPSNVEDWLLLWQGRKNGTPSLSMSLPPSLPYPLSLQPTEEPFDAPDFDVLQDPETDR